MSAHGFVQVVNEQAHTEMVRYDVFVALLFKLQHFDTMQLHAALGVCGEAGELADAIKGHVIYEKPLDRDNIIEELGDLRFYMQAVQNLYHISEQDVLQANANKLAKRYKGLTYSNEAAIERADKKD
jgi:NTP pyrophosphatase (non-canonical NTP hydrolase)